MFRYLFIVLVSFSVLSSNENTVKTSELELFLFKVGFESLLKDVDITKDKSTLNEQEIKLINEKMDLIMSELYKDKRVLLKDSKEKDYTPSFDVIELDTLKNEIKFLKKEIQKIKSISNKEIIKEKKILEAIEPRRIKKAPIKKTQLKIKAITRISKARVRSSPSIEAQIIEKLSKYEIIYLDYCDKFGWCKLKGRNDYIAQHILWIYKN